MAKRHSPRELSYTPVSTNADSDDDGITEEDVQKPSKRLKAVHGSAAESRSIPVIREPEDEAENDAENEHEHEHETENGRDAKQDKVAIKTEAGPEADADVDIDATRLDDAGTQLVETMSNVSEDTEGEVPQARGSISLPGDDDGFGQVTVCAWDGCKTGDLGTMDKLVEHLHAEHVEGKQRRYTCEWIGCPRKGKSHASAYALKAHLRSHTREKPYVCYLPECALAFARADALNKHIRSAHDIDLMRSIDPPRAVYAGGANGKNGIGYGAAVTNGNGAAASSAANGSAGHKTGSSKLKIIIKTPQSHAAGQDDSVDYGPAQHRSLTFVNEPGPDETTLTRDQGFTARELELPLEKLYALCRCQLRWSEAENEELRKECATWEDEYHRAWLECQVLLDQVLKSEKDWHKRRQAVLASLAEEEKRMAAAAAAASAAEGGGSGIKDEDEDSVGEDDNDNDNGDGDGDGDGDSDDNDGLDADVTMDGYSFADASSFSVVGSQLRNEVS